MDFGDHPGQIIQLISGNQQIGSLSFNDPALFNATIDILRNEGPKIYWDGGQQRLLIGLEPTAETETN